MPYGNFTSDNIMKYSEYSEITFFFVPRHTVWDDIIYFCKRNPYFKTTVVILRQ